MGACKPILQITKDFKIPSPSTNVVCRRKEEYIKGTEMAEKEKEREGE